MSSSEPARRFRLWPLVLALALFAGVLELGMRRVDNSYTKKRRILEARADQIEVLITGTSFGLFGVDPALLHADAFNVADMGQWPYYDDVIVRRYLPRMKRLKKVVVTLGMLGLQTRPLLRDYSFEHFWQIPFDAPNDPLDVRHFSVFALYPPDARFAALRRGFGFDLLPDLSDRGFLPVPAPPEGITELEAVSRAENNARLSRAEDLPLNESHLSRMLGALRARGIAVALIVMPVHHRCAAHVDPAARRRDQEALERLARQHGVTLRDYANDPRFDDGDFSLPDHLSGPGAQRFSRILDEEVLQKM